MFSKLWMSFGIAIKNIKANFLHTILSTLGIVIGVGALVAILSMLDGLEQYAREQITKTTSLTEIVVNTNTSKKVDGIWVKNVKQPVILPENLPELQKSLGEEADIQLQIIGTGIAQLHQTEVKSVTYFSAVLPDGISVTDDEIWKGSNAFKSRKSDESYSAIITYPLARQLKPEETGQLVGQALTMRGTDYRITGIVGEKGSSKNWMWIPIASFSDEDLKERPPQLIIEAPIVEKVEPYQAKIEDWLSEHFDDAENSFQIVTNAMRVKQANQGILLFKIVMGLITGISVIVGGIGIMNVLLISVTERTVEIGIRKATGAKRGDIVLQFLSESITVSVFGSFLGVLLGIGVAMLSIPIVKYFVDVPFQTSFTVETLALISVIAIGIGIIFGTYPAMRAATLTPVEAIRRE